jgi:hypothetical protein
MGQTFQASCSEGGLPWDVWLAALVNAVAVLHVQCCGASPVVAKAPGLHPNDAQRNFAGKLIWRVPWSDVLAPELPPFTSEVRDTQVKATHIVKVHLRRLTEPLVIECKAPEQSHRLQHAIYRCLSARPRLSVLSHNLDGGSIEDAALPQELVCILEALPLCNNLFAFDSSSRLNFHMSRILSAYVSLNSEHRAIWAGRSGVSHQAAFQCRVLFNIC